jgi:hypothetical protein
MARPAEALPDIGWDAERRPQRPLRRGRVRQGRFAFSWSTWVDHRRADRNLENARRRSRRMCHGGTLESTPAPRTSGRTGVACPVLTRDECGAVEDLRSRRALLTPSPGGLFFGLAIQLTGESARRLHFRYTSAGLEAVPRPKSTEFLAISHAEGWPSGRCGGLESLAEPTAELAFLLVKSAVHARYDPAIGFRPVVS